MQTRECRCEKDTPAYCSALSVRFGRDVLLSNLTQPRRALRTQTLTTSKAPLADEVDSPAKHMMNVTPRSFAEATKVRANLGSWKGYGSPLQAPPHHPVLSRHRNSTRRLEYPVLCSRCFPLALINSRM